MHFRMQEHNNGMVYFMLLSQDLEPFIFLGNPLNYDHLKLNLTDPPGVT